MPRYKLTYLPLRYRGEQIRWVLAAAGQTWEDVRVDTGSAEWARLKPTLPFGQVPVLEMDDGVVMCQSNAINRFLAKRYGLTGANDLEDARMDMIVDCIEDMLPPIFNAIYYLRTPEAKATWEEKKPGFLSKYEAFLVSNNGGDGYLVGNKLSWADITLALWLAYVGPLDSALYPKLAALKTRVEQQPGIADWIRRRPPPTREVDEF